MLSILSETQQAIVETIRMRLDTRQALRYMKDVGKQISRPTYFRYKKKVEEMKLERLYHIAKIGFEDQHLERIDDLELCKKLMWKKYNECQDPFKQVLILEKIASVQPYLSAYYEATKEVMRDRTTGHIDFDGKKELEMNSLSQSQSQSQSAQKGPLHEDNGLYYP